jgi:hypothetical protein
MTLKRLGKVLFTNPHRPPAVPGGVHPPWARHFVAKPFETESGECVDESAEIRTSKGLRVTKFVYGKNAP